MLRDGELSPLMAAVQDFLVALFFDGADLDEATARRFGEPHGVGDPAAGRLIFCMVAFILDRRGEDVIAFQHELLNALAGRTGKETVQ